MLAEPIFLCAVNTVGSDSSRIIEMLKNLSHRGRLITIDITDCRNGRSHRLIRLFTSLFEESRPVPIYLVGFGTHCTTVLTATSIPSYLLPPTNGGALEDIICGRIDSADAPVPTKPWLAGIVLIAPPIDIYRLDNLNSARRCSFLIVVSSKHRTEANAFRNALIAARRQPPTDYNVIGDSSMVGCHGVLVKTPRECDLRMLVIGGSDHMLRMNPLAL